MLLLAVVAAHASHQQFLDFAVGQSVGWLLGAVSSWGANLAAISKVADMNADERTTFVRSAIGTRVTLYAVFLAGSSVPVSVLAGDFVGTMAVVAAYGSLGLSSQWFFTASGRGGTALLVELLPRALIMFVSAAIMVASSVRSGEIFLSSGMLFVSVFSARVACGRLIALPSSVDWRGQLRIGLPGAVNDLVASVYLIAPSLLIAALRADLLAPYVVLDRLFRFAKTAAAPIIQALQSWVLTTTGVDRSLRVRVAILWMTLIAGLAGVAFPIAVAAFCSLVQMEIPDAYAVLFFALAVTASLSAFVLSAVGLMAQSRPVAVAAGAVVGAVTWAIGFWILHGSNLWSLAALLAAAELSAALVFASGLMKRSRNDASGGD